MSVQAMQSDWVGQVVDGRFTLLQWLGGSERVSVFLTELPGPTARQAAIKLIPADDGDAETYMAGWAATRPLSHPHLMRLYHTGQCEIDGRALIFVVYEYAEEVLSEILPDRALTSTEAGEMLEPVIDALSYLHAKGLVHGHLKPSNIMVVEDRLKLSGDSLQVAGQTGRRSSAESIYIAPETATGTISPAADLWGLGVTLVEALTQSPPVWNRSEDEDPVLPESIPQPFAGIARGCLRADPMARCTLDNVKTRLLAVQPVSEPAATAEMKARSKNRIPVLVSAAIVLVAVFAVVQTRYHRTEPSSTAASEARQQASSADSAQAKPPAAGLPAAPEPRQSPAREPAVSPPPTQVPTTPPPAAQASKSPASDGAVAEQVMPDLLQKALASIHGKVNVRIRVSVDLNGKVSDAAFESKGPSQYFANAAIKAAQKWKFKPPQADGQPVPSAWILQFQFTPSGAEVTPFAAR